VTERVSIVGVEDIMRWYVGTLPISVVCSYYTYGKGDIPNEKVCNYFPHEMTHPLSCN